MPDHHRYHEQDLVLREGRNQQQHREEARHLRHAQVHGRQQARRGVHDHQRNEAQVPVHVPQRG